MYIDPGSTNLNRKSPKGILLVRIRKSYVLLVINILKIFTSKIGTYKTKLFGLRVFTVP